MHETNISGIPLKEQKTITKIRKLTQIPIKCYDASTNPEEAKVAALTMTFLKDTIESGELHVTKAAVDVGYTTARRHTKTSSNP